VFLAAVLGGLLLYPGGVIRPPLTVATSGGDPYDVPQVTDTNPDPNIVETTIVADETTVEIADGVMADAMTFNGTIPGPEFRLTPGQRVIVHFENHLDTGEPTGIHWHGIELSNASDGTSLSQNQVAPGDSFLYDFVAPREGVYWYHPHHEFSTNQVFKGLYGSIIIKDPNEAALIASGVLPSAAQTHTLALGDITVCKDVNDTATYDPSLPWVGLALPAQAGPHPDDLCDTPMDNDGHPIEDGAGDPIPLAAGAVPNIQSHGGRVNEGQTVLTNGFNVGHRNGNPAAPGSLPGTPSLLDVQPGQGLRLQVGNTPARSSRLSASAAREGCSTTRCSTVRRPVASISSTPQGRSSSAPATGPTWSPRFPTPRPAWRPCGPRTSSGPGAATARAAGPICRPSQWRISM
jgi:FtsP/CotA-like multicopper oxidase with cupredoxin domain